jgi:PhnB protein
MAVKPIPDGYHSVTSRLCISGAANAIEFYKRAYPATELMRFVQPDGKLGHAEIQIGDSIAMLSDEFPEMGVRSRLSLSGSPASIFTLMT